MLIVGVIGGIGSGKSLVTDFFCRLGAERIDADQLGHDVLRLPEVVQVLRGKWGDGILKPDGSVNRRAVAGLVFGKDVDREQLEFLQSVTHPRIAERMLQEVERFRQRGNVPVVVLDAAILVEAGWDQQCDRIVFIDAEPEQRLQRVYQRGWTAADLAAREARQVSLEEKRKLADWVIDNSGSVDHTFAQVRQFWRSLDLPA